LDTLEIVNLRVSVEGNEILKGVNLSVPKGEVHALMGPNGSGKSTLANTLMGHPGYQITEGDIRWKGESLVGLGADERARRGLFLAFQYPAEIYGVSVTNFLRMAQAARFGVTGSFSDFQKTLKKQMEILEIEPAFSQRYLNEGFSGGEKKRHEILQMGMLEPEMAILDETDSGLAIDALKIVSRGVNGLRGPKMGMLLITHYQRLLNYIIPDRVHVLIEGRVVLSGDRNLALELEAQGYDWVKDAVPAS
jgi:Fe-S cluster assembly ATP-binding protein